MIGKALGYSSEKLSGPAASRIGSLRQYGLIEKAPQGRLRVSDLALDLLLHGPESDVFRAAARKAALTPPLFADLQKEYAEASPDAIRAHLIKADFSEEATAKIITAFRDTMSFAKLNSESYNEPDDNEDVGDEELEVRDEKRTTPDRQSQRTKEVQSVAYSWPLGGGNKVELGFATEPTQAQLDVMLAQLQIMRQVAPTQPRHRVTPTQG